MLSSVFTSALSRGDRGILSPDLPHTGTRHTRFPDSQSCLCLSPPPHRTHDLRQLCGCASLPWCILSLRISKRREKAPLGKPRGAFHTNIFHRKQTALCILFYRPRQRRLSLFFSQNADRYKFSFSSAAKFCSSMRTWDRKAASSKYLAPCLQPRTQAWHLMQMPGTFEVSAVSIEPMGQ